MRSVRTFRPLRAMRLIAVLAVGALALTACGGSSGGSTSGGGDTGSGGSGSGLKVGLAYDVGGRGDKSFNDLAYSGISKAKSQLGISFKELAATQGEAEQAKEDRLTLLATSGYNPIVAVGFAYAPALKKVSVKYPKINFAIVDGYPTDVKGSNVANLVFTENQSSFLVGVAAALATKTDNVGFIGGVSVPLIQKFQAGYQAGVAAVNKNITVQVKYLSQPPSFQGFNDPAAGKVTAQGMYDNKADVVYAAAGGSGSGLFQAAAADKKLAIGVDSDQYKSATSSEQPYILTSALKGVDTAVFDFIKDVKAGSFKAGQQQFSLKDGGVGYATSNSKIKAYQTKIESYKQQIISGKITVPTAPSGS